MSRKIAFILISMLAVLSLVAACGKSTTPSSSTTTKASSSTASSTPKATTTSAVSSTPKATTTAPPMTSAAPKPSQQEQREEAARKEGKVVLWGTTGSEAPQYLAPFIQRYPWLKVEIQDLSSEPLAEKVIAEFKAGKHNWDLMTQSEEMMTVMPIRDLVTPYEWPNVVGKWPASAVGPDNLYIRNHVTPMGVIYNSKIISPADAPKSWEDLLNPKWKGKTAASKSSDEAPLALAAWWGKDGGLDWDRSFKFWEDVFKITQPRVVSGYTGPMQTLLVAGEFQIMVYGSAGSAAMLQLVNKLPVEIAAMDRILGKSNTYSISKNAQHPNAARMLVDYMTSTEGSTLHSEVSIKIPLNPKVTNSKVVDFFNKKGQVLNISKFITKENMAKSSAFWNKLLGL